MTSRQPRRLRQLRQPRAASGDDKLAPFAAWSEPIQYEALGPARLRQGDKLTSTRVTGSSPISSGSRPACRRQARLGQTWLRWPVTALALLPALPATTRHHPPLPAPTCHRPHATRNDTERRKHTGHLRDTQRVFRRCQHPCALPKRQSAAARS